MCSSRTLRRVVGHVGARCGAHMKAHAPNTWSVASQDLSLDSLTGNAPRVGTYIDTLCSTSGNQTNTDEMQRWSQLQQLDGYGEADHVTLANGQTLLLDVDMTVASLTVQGTLRWDTSKDGLVLSAGYVRVQRGGM
jgi:hypothetical protein